MAGMKWVWGKRRDVDTLIGVAVSMAASFASFTYPKIAITHFHVKLTHATRTKKAHVLVRLYHSHEAFRAA